MMKKLWNYIDARNLSESRKYRAVLCILGILYPLAGLLIWLLVGRYFLPGLDWMVCFAGYPLIASWFVVIFYSARHGFHDGLPD